MAADDLINEIKEKLADLLAPINGGVGADCSFEDVDAIKNEIDKSASMGGAKTDWNLVVNNSAEALTEKTKDFRIALYWAAGRATQEGTRGLLEGFVLLQTMMETYWDTMYPPLKRPKARANLAMWLAEYTKTLPSIKDFQPTVKDTDVVKALEKVSRAVDNELAEKLGEVFQGLREVRNIIVNIERSLPKEAPPPPPPPPPPPRAAPEPSAAPAEQAAPVYAAPEPSAPVQTVEAIPPELDPAQITDVDVASATLQRCTLLLQRAGDTVRGALPKLPVGYRLQRTGLWLELSEDPPAEGGVMSNVAGPADYVRTQLNDAASAGDPASLHTAAENMISENPLWLDPQRHSIQALEQLGDEYEGIRQTVLVQLAALLARAPALPALKFNDGTATADPDTLAWLETAIKGAFASGGGGGGPRASNPTDKAIQEAQAKLAGDAPDLAGAFAILHKAAKTAPAPADKFRARLALAKIALQVSQVNIAKAQLEGLERMAAHHHLAEWQPDLCADLYGALYLVHRATNAAYGMEAPPEARAKEMGAFEKLCELDASAALKLTMEAVPQ